MHLSSILLVLSLTASVQFISAAPLVTETRFVLAKRQCPPGTAPGPPPPPPPAYSAAECYKATQNVACYQAPAQTTPSGPPKSDKVKLPDLSCYVLPAATLPGYPAFPVIPPPVLPPVPAAPIPAAPVLPALPGLPEASLPDLSSMVIPSLPKLPGLPSLPGLGR